MECKTGSCHRQWQFGRRVPFFGRSRPEKRSNSREHQALLRQEKKKVLEGMNGFGKMIMNGAI